MNGSDLGEGISSSSNSLEDEGGSAEGTGRVVFFPGFDAHLMEIFFALMTIFKIFIFFVHLCEADCAVCVVFQVDIFGIFLIC